MKRLLFVLAMLSSSFASAERTFVWWEGENPKKTNFPRRSWFGPHTFPKTRHLLSGGDWLSNSGKRTGDEAFATYQLTVPETGEYNLWTRKFWKHGPFRWRFDEGEWNVCGRRIALADNTSLRTHVGANWVHLGKVKLSKGKHTFELRLLADKGDQLTAAFDAFLLIEGPWKPNGALKPGESSGKAGQGFFAWEPPLDGFEDAAGFDLRRLNEPRAGAKGYVRRDGDDFRLADGQKVRFWAVNVSAGNAGQSRDSVDYLARKLAKQGVNMVRYHSALFDRSGDGTEAHAGKLDDLQYLVAAMKKQGIYTKLSFFFPLWYKPTEAHGIGGYDKIKNDKAFAVLYFLPRMQTLWKSWIRNALTAENPYGPPLADEPALSIVEIVNEDSLFFWTFTRKNVPPQHWKRLERMYSDWLKRKHGSVAKAFAAWGNVRAPGDNPDADHAALYDAWHMTREGFGRSRNKARRVADQVRFLATLQKDFYAEAKRYITKDLGYGGLISASNWTVADARTLGALERWTYTAGDVIDRHGYFGGPHKGKGSSYSVRVGHTFQSRSAIRNPQKLPLQVQQVYGYPHIISELGWPNPNRFRAEQTFLSAAMGCLHDIDGLFHFAVGSNFLTDSGYGKFPVSSPVVAGSFPAAAVCYRRGDLKEAPAMFKESLDPSDLMSLVGSASIEARALDQLRKGGEKAADEPAPDDVDPLTFYVGKVLRRFGGPDPRPTRPGRFIDREKGIVRSATGEMIWDYKRGLVTIDSPRSQGVCGFVSDAGLTTLSTVSFECDNEYAALWAVSLDGKPLGASKRILLQAMTEERPYGFRQEGGKITDLGGGPMNVRRIEATVTLKLAGDGPVEVTPLTPNAYPAKGKIRIAGGDGEPVRIELSPTHAYHLVTR